MPKIISRAEAKAQGLKTFYTGKPCPHGHIAERLVAGKCVECNRERNKLRPKVGKVKTGKAVVPTARPHTRRSYNWRDYASEIKHCWQVAVASIVTTGTLLNEAKANVDHGDWLKLVEELPFGEDTAQRLMAIARHPVISNTEHVRDLPPSWGTLYQLTRLPDDVLLARIEDHSIHPDMERKDVAALLGPGRQHKRNNKPTPRENFAVMAQEIEDQKAHIAELEAARESGVYIDRDDDEATMAAKIAKVIGQVRIFALIVELQKQITGEPNNDIPPQSLQ
jgi:hypothetical protein